jgi:hypothetical protein
METICIFLHDIGHIGYDYLDSVEAKNKHWELGAKIAGKLFGQKGFDLVAGHCDASGYQESALRKPDKYSWYIAPSLWIYWNTFLEPKTAMGYKRWEAVKRFKAQVKHNIESGEYRDTHNLYLERCNGCKNKDGDKRNGK